MYGALAVAALALRVAFEQGRPGALAPLAAAASLGGPLLMAAALLRAAYFSRSLLPVGVACALGVVLLPQLEAEIRAWLPFVSWGTGLASAACACAIALACFPIRASAALADLGEGDRLSPGHPFPFQRRDHTLFTWPLLASAVFLAAKVDTWNMCLTPAAGKTAAALMLAGLAWTVMAVYARGWRRAPLLVHLGWLYFVGGIYFAWFYFLPDGCWQGAVVLCGSALTALYLFYAYGLAPARPWAQDLLAAPVRKALRLASILFSAAAIASMFAGGSAGDPALLAFATAQLIWFGLTDGHPVFGSLLFLQSLTAVLAWAAPGSLPLVARLTPQACATPALVFLLSIVGAQYVLEAWPAGEGKLRPLAAPVFLWAAAAAFAAGVAWTFDAAYPRLLTDGQRWLAIALLLAAARAQACAPLALFGLLLAYVQLAGDRLFAPLPLGACALALAALAEGGKRLHERRPSALAGPYAQDSFRSPALPWILGPALALAALSVLRFAVEPGFMDHPAQLAGPYLSAAAFAVAGLSWPNPAVFSASAVFVTLGNMLAVRFYFGETLRANGFVRNHIACLGAAATVLQAWAGRAWFEQEAIRAFLDRVGLARATGRTWSR